ncbi:hypothetical protein OG874_21745 [Nocardia sp. NBC_00565]|uniref:hypothetical protein n=1 Tax=Nocardia sp. NBC_00565 TaxID=2975993 RepID=UPI002E7FC56C|nr:hypothetical protein [Nocardia sp. NBC_00565]WUC07545.1 hypothetical protein OG874_21745 [Nocardia sp. NBC_00565]
MLEREPEYCGLACAVYTDDEIIRIFQTAGVADELAADMNVDSTVQLLHSRIRNRRTRPDNSRSHDDIDHDRLTGGPRCRREVGRRHEHRGVCRRGA